MILIKPISNRSEFKTIPSFKVQGYYELSMSYMNAGLKLLENGLTQSCLVLGHLSVKAMLNAVYSHLGGLVVFMNKIPFDELLSFVRDQNIIDLDTELFLSRICFLTRQPYISTTQNMGQEHLTSIMSRLEEILSSLSEQIGDTLLN